MLHVKEENVRSLQKYYCELSDRIVELNGLLEDTQENERLSIKQRSAIINARNQFVLEREDLHDYIQTAQTLLKKSETENIG